MCQASAEVRIGGGHEAAPSALLSRIALIVLKQRPHLGRQPREECTCVVRREPYWSAAARTWLSLRKLQEHTIIGASLWAEFTLGLSGARRARPQSADPGFR